MRDVFYTRHIRCAFCGNSGRHVIRDVSYARYAMGTIFVASSIRREPYSITFPTILICCNLRSITFPIHCIATFPIAFSTMFHVKHVLLIALIEFVHRLMVGYV